MKLRHPSTGRFLSIAAPGFAVPSEGPLNSYFAPPPGKQEKAEVLQLRYCWFHTPLEIRTLNQMEIVKK